ncbi:Uncharacterised protein [Mycobacteroides abscessus subsp. massiliense]|nr:Uncharacterised protein [Mycobacteroides abscessus subsp. massiliense]
MDLSIGQFGDHLLSGQVDGRHGTGARNAQHQLRTTADDLDAVLQRQGLGNDRSRDLTHRMSDDGPGPDTVRGQRRRERDLHREQCRLDTVNAGDGLRGRDSVGDREARLGVDQRLKTSNGLGEYRFLTE